MKPQGKQSDRKVERKEIEEILNKFALFAIVERMTNMDDRRKYADAILKVFHSHTTQIVDEIEKVFDQFRSSNQKNAKGKREYGVGNFDVGARDLYENIMDAIKTIERI